MKKSPIFRLNKVIALAVGIAAAVVTSAQANFVLTNSLTITAGGTLFMDDTTGLTPAQVILPANVLIAASNGLIVQAPNNAAHLTNISNIKSWLDTGYNGGLWSGTGITGTTVFEDAAVNGVLSVMLLDNVQFNYANYAGATGLAAPFEQVFTRITYTGDYDFNGVVDEVDFGSLDFYLSSSLVAQGDLNADGLLDELDYGLLDFVLSSQPYGDLTSIASFAGGPKASGVVPEPASAALLFTGAAGLLGMRKRKKSI